MFPKGEPIDLVQKWPFFHLFFKGNIGQKNVFYDILQRKNAFLGYKNINFKKSKKWHFSKGFGPKMAIFPTFFFSQYRPGKCLLGYSRTKKRLSRLSKQEVQEVEKTNVVGPKTTIFPTFFFRQYTLGKCLLW